MQRELSRDEHALYELIWIRTLASQMEDAKGQTVSLRIAGASSTGENVEFGASGTVITFRGFLAAYEEGRDETEAKDDDERRLPNVSEGDAVQLKELEPQGHETNPPARYTEATLVRTLEELGIGRPSTYASILGTILDRGYVFKKGTALVPSFLAFSVVQLLEQHFGRLVDYDFTARMEDDLDRIASGDEQRNEWLQPLLLRRRRRERATTAGLKELVSDLGGIDAREINSIQIGNGIVAARRPLRPVSRARRRAGERSRRVVPDELTVETRGGAARAAVAGSRARHRSGDRSARSSRRTAATGRTSPRRCRKGRRTSRRPRRSSSRWRSTRSRSRRRCSCCSCRA